MRSSLVFAPLLVWALAVLATPSTAHASHFRYGHLTWRPLGGTTVEFTLTGAFRRGYPGTAPDGRSAVGDLITETIGATRLFYGDGASTATLRFRVTAIDPAADWVIGVAVDPADVNRNTIPHTYPVSGTYTAFIDSCCRIGGLRNSSGSSYRVETIVDFSGNSSPVSSLTPIVLCPDNNICTFLIPTGDVDPDSVLSFRLATAAESRHTSLPPNFSVDPVSGIVTFDVRDSMLATIPGHLWTAQVVIEDRDANTGALRTKVGIDFIVQISVFVPPLPTCEMTPAGPYAAFVGQPFQLTVQGGTVHHGATVTINSGGLPAGATSTPGLPATSTANAGSGSALAVTIDWTPGAGQVGPNPVFFTVSDSFGQQVQCQAVINVVSNRPPEIVCNAPVVLWSPNHDLIDVSSAFTVSDPDSDPVTLAVTMYSDEPELPETGDGTGRHAPDFKNEMVGGRGLLVRAERQGPGDGRVYVMVVRAEDGRGGVTTKACVVAVVPHDQNQDSLNAVMLEAATLEAAIQFAVGGGGLLPIAGTQQHGLAQPTGPKQ